MTYLDLQFDNLQLIPLKTVNLNIFDAYSIERVEILN
jgi:hypothetical protein